MEPQTFFKHQMKTRKQIRGRARRAEAAWLRKMRAVVFARDGGCRAAGIGWCEGDLTLAHLPPWRRSQTRGLPHEDRHRPSRMVMLCVRHHNMEERHQLLAHFLSDQLANGSIRWEAVKAKQESAA